MEGVGIWLQVHSYIKQGVDHRGIQLMLQLFQLKKEKIFPALCQSMNPNNHYRGISLGSIGDEKD